MLNCREITERASDFVDGALPWSTRVQVRLHLLMCRICREYVRQLTLVVRALRCLPQEEISRDRQEELLEVFRAWRK